MEPISAWAALTWRAVVDIARGWASRSKSPLHIESAVANYERGHQWFTVGIRFVNRGDASLFVDCIRLLKPTGGSLRDDPQVPIMIIGDHIPEEPREKWMGKAVTVMGLSIHLSPQERDSVNVVFVPPVHFRGGDLVLRLEANVHSAKLRRTSQTIRRQVLRD